MNILHLTDIHGAAYLLDYIADEIKKSDLVILSGDITHFGGIKHASEIIEKIQKLNSNVFAVTGNCDNPAIEEFLNSAGISLHLTRKEFGKLELAGLGGSLPCPGTTPNEFTEEEAESWLKEFSRKYPLKQPAIFVSHQPPYNTKNDLLTSGIHVGSRAVLQFLKRFEPLICLTGHIHEAAAISHVGNCLVCNPGPLRAGFYGRISVSDENSVKTEFKHVTV